MPASVLTKVWRRLQKAALGNEAYARRRGVTIGSGCRILSDVATTEPWLVSIGDRVTVSSGVRFITHDGSGWLVRDERGRRFRYAPIAVGSDVFIGAGATVLPGVSIVDRVVVGAGSVVTRSLTEPGVYAGVPARFVGSWERFESRVLTWPAAGDMRGEAYRERVDSIVRRD